MNTPVVSCPRRFRLTQNLLLAASVVAFTFLTRSAHAEANYVYHERTGNDPGCGGQYVTTLNPTSAQSYAMRFKVEFQFYTDNVRVYYTTDGSTPSGSFGVGSNTTTVVTGSYTCTFGSPLVDVVSATIPAQPAGTVVKYIVSAWHSGGGLEIFGNGPGTPCVACGTPTSSSSLATVFQYTVGSTTDLYWDINGATAGAGGATPTGNWSTAAANWSTVFDGTAATAVWTSGRNAVFSAGTDATGAFTVTVPTALTAGGIKVEEGTVSIGSTAATTLSAGANVSISSGATLSISSSTAIAPTTSATMTLNGGTMRNTASSTAGSFVSTLFTTLTLNGGGTVSYTGANLLNIINATPKITGTGPLTKSGAGVLAIVGTAAGNNDWTGGTIITDGEVRVRTANNALPLTTDVTVTSPGILNLNSLNQQIGSLTGNGSVGTGSGTLTISGSASTIFDGVLKNITNAGASGVSTGNGKLVKDGSGVITFNGLNDINGTITLTAGGINVTPSASLCGPICDIVVNGGALNLSNTLQVIENLSSTLTTGTINLGSGHTLVCSNVSSSAYSGAITGPGSILKLNNGATQRTLTLNGANSYDGNTIIGGGNIAVGSATALGSTAGYTDVASGNEVIFTGAAVNFTCAEPFRIAGPGGSDNGAIAVLASAAPTLSGPITLTGDATITVSSSASATFNNPNAITALANQNLTLRGGANAAGVKAITGAINLGSGGITKLEGGEWVLSGNSVYTGPTLINAGTLSLSGSGSISNSLLISVTNGAVFKVSGLAIPFTLQSGQTLSNNAASTATIHGTNNTGSGTVSVSYVSGTPCFVVTNGGMTLSASTVFKVNNTGAALGAGSYKLISKATSGNVGLVAGTVPGSVVVSGGGTTAPASLQIVNGELYLNVGATTVALASSSPTTNGYLNPVTFTATVQTNGVTVGNATGTVLFQTNGVAFVTNGLAAGSTNFSLASLSRGTNLITAIYSGDANYLGSTNTLAQIVTNHPPAAPIVSYNRVAAINSFHISITNLLANVTDADLDTVTLTSVGTSTNGIALLNSAGFLNYQNTNSVNDQFTYTVDDGNGGIVTALVNLVVQPFIAGQNATVTVAGSTATVGFFGIPGYGYGVQRSTNLTSWATILTTNAPAGGGFEWTDDFSDLGVVPGSAYYRLQWNP